MKAEATIDTCPECLNAVDSREDFAPHCSIRCENTSLRREMLARGEVPVTSRSFVTSYKVTFVALRGWVITVPSHLRDWTRGDRDAELALDTIFRSEPSAIEAAARVFTNAARA